MITRIARDVPLIADADVGFGGPAQVARTVGAVVKEPLVVVPSGGDPELKKFEIAHGSRKFGTELDKVVAAYPFIETEDFDEEEEAAMEE